MEDTQTHKTNKQYKQTHQNKQNMLSLAIIIYHPFLSNNHNQLFAPNIQFIISHTFSLKKPISTIYRHTLHSNNSIFSSNYHHLITSINHDINVVFQSPKSRTTKSSYPLSIIVAMITVSRVLIITSPLPFNLSSQSVIKYNNHIIYILFPSSSSRS
jgi:hypothetical protein